MSQASDYRPRQRLGLILGPVLLALCLVLPAPGDMAQPAWHAAGVAILMAVWWLTEAIPIPVTALLPLALFPMVGAGDIQQAATPYANDLIFLFMGGFLIALAMQRWNLHRRIALNVVLRTGTGPRGIIAGFMLASAFLSMWVSNTATAMMMFPIGMAVIRLGESRAPAFATALMLGIAYACNIGGIGTLIGTPPNALLAGFMRENYGLEVGFAEWLLLGLPIVILGLPLAFLALTGWLYRDLGRPLAGEHSLIRDELGKLGPMHVAEKWVALVFVTAAGLWIVRPWLAEIVPGLSDAGIAMAAAIILFLIPVDWRKGVFVHDWRTAEGLPWDVLILFGGGLSLASAFDRTGLSRSLGEALSVFGGMPTVGLILIVTAAVILLTELTSNTATAATLLPVMAALAIGLDQSPLLFAAPAAIAASAAFMLPVATPPNAIVYGSGHISIPQMARAGVVLNLVFIVLITSVCALLTPMLG